MSPDVEVRLRKLLVDLEPPTGSWWTFDSTTAQPLSASTSSWGRDQNDTHRVFLGRNGLPVGLELITRRNRA